MSLRKIADSVVESFTNVFTFEVDPDLSEPEQIEKVISETAMVAGLIASIQPLPFLDLFVLAPLYAKLTLQIGRIKGFDLSEARAQGIAKEILGAIGVALTSQAVIGWVGKLIPLGNVLLTFPLTYGATWAVGSVVDYYFDCEREGKQPSADEMKELFRRQFKVGKARGRQFDQNEMAQRARDLRSKVAGRDSSLVTKTRLRPKPSQRPKPPADLPSLRSVADLDDAPSSIKITLKPKGSAAVEPPPTPQVSVAPAEAVEAPKTIGPTTAEDGPIEIGFKPVEKTLGGAPEVEVSVEPKPPPHSSADPTVEVSVEPRQPELDTPLTIGALLPGLIVHPAKQVDPAEDPDEAEQPTGLVEQLERLANLKERGVLTQDEFERAKQKLLGT